jgi:glutamine---fructose-6-phosphate transaminase (isomerizing)
MCGIVGYTGNQLAYSLIINGLKRLEYRGYDSAGIALVEDQLNIYKKSGKVRDLERATEKISRSATTGMGHTRWATHGPPTDENAHPQLSNSGKIAIVHNGIIENYLILKEELINKGYRFNSETDTEVLVNFIEDIATHHEGPLEEAIRIALSRVVGAYGMVLVTAHEPNRLFVARKSSPMVIGVGSGEHYVASDASPFIEYTNEVIYLKDGEIAVLDPDHIRLYNLENIPQTPYVETLDLELEEIEKGGYDHFMLKEIFEQPRSVADCMRGRVDVQQNLLKLGGMQDKAKPLYRAERIIVTACGTSYYAGLVAEYLFEDLCRIPVEVEYASEFRYRNPVIREGDVVIAISQSGETADTLVAVEMAKELGATVYGVCNVVSSSIARATHAGVYTHAGPEIGVASTKAFTAQITVLAMLAITVAKYRGTLTHVDFLRKLHALSQMPALINKVLESKDLIREIASQFKDAANFLYLGRGYNYPVAMEGALKLKEISYIHAEGYPAAEMKHGPIALVDQDMPIVVIATKDQAYEKIISNIQELKSRKGKVIAIVTEGDDLVTSMVDYVIEIPLADEHFTALISVVPLQLLAYYIGVLKGCNVDQPRNLAKSVTVE